MRRHAFSICVRALLMYLPPDRQSAAPFLTSLLPALSGIAAPLYFANAGILSKNIVIFIDNSITKC